MGDEFSLFTSLRYDPGLIQIHKKGLSHAGWNFENESPFYMLDYHRDRMLRAATHWKWQPAIDALTGDHGLHALSQVAQGAIGSSQHSPLRLRILVTHEGEIRFEKFSTREMPLENMFPERLPPPSSVHNENDPKREPRYTLLVDDVETARSEYTHYKTTKRAMYDSARHRAKIIPTENKEVLIIHQDSGCIMEGSTTTPYFWRDGKWVTPPVSASFSWKDGSGGQDGTSRRWALEKGLASEQVVKGDSLLEGEECWISNGVRGFLCATIALPTSI
ncbi:Fc.00g101100.m01.CDS01 [Cosmosporella sp. VM-42]